MISPLKVIVPSRGRPGNIHDLCCSWQGDPSGELCVVVDDDDPDLAGYVEVCMANKVSIYIGPNDRPGMAAPLNRVAKAVGTPAETLVVGFLGDDHRPRTPGWQERVLRHAEFNPLAVMYGDDLIQGRNLPTAVFLDARIVRILGYMVPPDAYHLFLDNFWKTLGEQLGTLHFDPFVVFEHMHPLVGKAPSDDGYVRVNAPSVWEHDEAVFKAWLADIDTHLAPLRALQAAKQGR